MGGVGSGNHFAKGGSMKRDFDPEKHCGAVVKQRNKEIMTRRIQQTEYRLRALKPTSSNYSAKYDLHKRILERLEIQLQKIIEHPDDRPCVNRKGMGTDHEGDGMCHNHCQCHGRRSYHDISGNVYTQIRHRKLQDAIKMVELQTIDIMDLAPEAKVLKAMTVLYLEDVQRKKNISPKDIEAVVNLIEKTGRQIERINAIQLKAGVVTHAAVVSLTSAMANEMLFVAQEQNGQTFDAQKFIEAVKSRWSQLSIDSNTKALPVPRHSREPV